MSIPSKLLKLRETIFALRDEYCNRLENASLSRQEKKSKSRDYVCSVLNITKDRYYRASMSLEKIEKLQKYRKAIREKMKNEDKYFLLKRKVRGFLKRGVKSKSFTYKDVVNRFGETPKCNLTGLPIDFSKTETYQLDHIIPVSKGGNSSLDNVQLIHPTANRMKSDIDMDIFVKLCKLIASKYK